MVLPNLTVHRSFRIPVQLLRPVRDAVHERIVRIAPIWVSWPSPQAVMVIGDRAVVESRRPWGPKDRKKRGDNRH